MKNEMTIHAKRQLELTLPAQTCSHGGHRRPKRFSRARWWFEQMHRVVDEAANWQPQSPVGSDRPELTLSRAPFLTPRR